MSEVGLLWIGVRPADDRLLREVGACVRRALGCGAARVAVAEHPPDTFDPRRGQHASTPLLRWASGLQPWPAPRVLALTDQDLFIPVLTFVYGEAQLGGRAAVVSTARLGPPGPRLAARLGKEAVHELGHTWGLLHCDGARCAMRRSPSLPEVDAKSDELCGDCRSRLRDARREREP